MAENIKLNTPIFCIGPQVGTYCCLNNEVSPVTMQVKNSSGTLIRTYTFSPNTTLETKPYVYSTNTSFYTTGAIMPIKSFILDIADNWGYNLYVGLRSVEFYDENDELIYLTSSDFTAYATTNYSSTYMVENVFNNNLSKINTWSNTGWLSGYGATTNQRIICVLNDKIYAKKIVINNAHNYGGNCFSGCKNITMYYYSSYYTDTTYGVDSTSLFKIYDAVLDKHADFNEVDDQIMELKGFVPGAHAEPVGIKYVGPKNQDSFYDNALFYTLEKAASGNRSYYTYERDNETGEYVVNSLGELSKSSEVEYNSNIIRKWRINNESFTLDLVSSYYKNSEYDYWFSADAFAIQTHQASLLDHCPIGTGEIYFTTTSGLSKYDTILIGPSSDTDNVGAVEEVYIHSIVGDLVSIRTYGGVNPTIYEYVEGDPITVIKYAYLLSSPKPLIDSSNIRYGFDPSGGSLFKLNLSSFCDVLGRQYSDIFSGSCAAFWNHIYNTISFVKGCNLIHYDFEQEKPTQSQFLHNTFDDEAEILNVYSIDINGYDIYRLQDKMLFLDDEGRQTLDEYISYNYIVDSLEVYSSSVTVYASNTCVGYQGYSVITAVVRDQYGVGLFSKEVSFSVTEDIGGTFYPSDGNVVTDGNGVCTIQYYAGAGYIGQAFLLAKAVGANTVFGSMYAVGETKVSIFSQYSEILQIKSIERDFYKTCSIMCNSKDQSGTIPLLSYVRRSMFGGEWEWKGAWNYYLINPTIEDRNKAPDDSRTPLITLVYQPTFNNIKTDYKGEITSTPKMEFMPRTYVLQHDIESEHILPSESIAKDKRRLSQNYLSRHLSTGNVVSTTLNQFSFTQEAIPEFWSERNQPNISYWIRLRPYAYSLNPETLEIFVYEVSWAGTTNSVDIVPLGSTTLFDAGSGLSGIDFNYDFPTDFHNNATVFVKVVVYDEAPIPNIITVSYWFTIIPDYTRPYVENRVPDVEAVDIPINTEITFDILDKGDGVDIATLEVFINNRQSDYSFIEYEPGQFNVVCIINKNFVYSQEIKISISVRDLSDNSNLLLDSWVFYCASSTGPWFDEDKLLPGRCLSGVDRTMDDISAQVYAINNTGIKYDSLKLDIGGKNRNIKITPIIYRLK